MSRESRPPPSGRAWAPSFLRAFYVYSFPSSGKREERKKDQVGECEQENTATDRKELDSFRRAKSGRSRLPSSPPSRFRDFV